MIAVDTSALFAILAHEPEELLFLEVLNDNQAVISSMTWLEAFVVITSRIGDDGGQALRDLLEDAGVSHVPFDAAQASAAFDAFRRFGKGQGHAAQLNFGDCAAYALARARNLPLLFKGEDFAKTDVRSAVGDVGG
ncbi:MAG: type II toxin-antitoxin system VapC family toxin [Pseudomonadota bacterium]